MKTAIYMRVSTNRQTQAQTIEQQLERLQRHLELQGEPWLTENVGGQGHLTDLSEIPVAIKSSIAPWESALECRFATWIAHQSSLHWQAVYWSKSLAASAHPAIRHPSSGKPRARAGSYAGRGVDIGGHGTGP